MGTRDQADQDQDQADQDQADQAETGARPWPAGLTELLAAARSNAPEAMERLLHTASVAPASAVRGVEYLLFTCADVPCALPLTALREVMRTTPETIPLPHSPPWMRGLFPLRAEVLALVDPAPMLLGRQHLPVVDTPARPAGARDTATALVVGSGARALAWVVGAVGAIAAIEAADVRTGSDADLPPRERYVTGLYADARTGERYTLLDAERLLDDLLGAIAEGGRDHG